MKGRTEASPPARRCSRGLWREDGAVAVAFGAKVNIFGTRGSGFNIRRKRAFVLPPAKQSGGATAFHKTRFRGSTAAFRKRGRLQNSHGRLAINRRVLRRSHALQEINALRLLIKTTMTAQ